ncbi:hypothetical protein EK904_003888 [Melospiza melodia maxima]|nr:hypothetical protein EK904_003888 [Melospiza melodia maxima]
MFVGRAAGELMNPWFVQEFILRGSHHRTKPTITGRVVQEKSCGGVFVVALQHTELGEGHTLG